MDEKGSPVRRVSYAQNGEDVRAWRALRDVEAVFYVEVGASDPIVDSLTAALHEDGGHGILIEADPVAAEALKVARPQDTVIAAAAHSRPGTLMLHLFDRRGWGSVNEGRSREASTHVIGSQEVPAVRVGDVLQELAPREVHFMSVDVEGHEAAVLAGADLAVHRPWILCVEATAPNSRTATWQAWEPDVLAADYRFVAFDGLNRWYVAAEHRHLSESLAEPFGVLDRLLDGWVPVDLATLEGRLRRSDEDVVRLHAALATEQEQHQRSAEQLRIAEARLAEEESLRVARSAELQELRADAAQVQILRAELAQVGAALAAARATAEHMERSRSWRYTAALRTVLHTATTTRQHVRLGRARTVALRAMNDTLVRHPSLRAVLREQLSSVPAVDRRLRTWYVDPADLVPPPPRQTLHALADRRLHASFDALVEHYEPAAAAPERG